MALITGRVKNCHYYGNEFGNWKCSCELYLQLHFKSLAWLKSYKYNLRSQSRYTCLGFALISFQCFKLIPLVQIQMKFSCNFQVHSLSNFFSAFTTEQFSLWCPAGPPFCLVKRSPFALQLIYAIFWNFSSALPCILYTSVSGQSPQRTRFMFSQRLFIEEQE